MVVIGALSVLLGWFLRSNSNDHVGCVAAGGTVNGIFCNGATSAQIGTAMMTISAVGTLAILGGIVFLVFAYLRKS
jgi:hypothetical protein